MRTRKVMKLESYYGNVTVCLEYDTHRAWLELESHSSVNTMAIPWEAGVLLMNDDSNTNDHQY